LFLGKCFKHVVAVDGSEAAINLCNKEINEKGFKNIDFINSLIEDPDLPEVIQSKLETETNELPLYIFSRFFLHSINDADEDQLISLIDKLLFNRKGAVYLEFRTKEDELLSKYTGSHYRRYVDPLVLIKKFADIGYGVDYHVEGIGFAKYKIDDAHVARLVFSKL